MRLDQLDKRLQRLQDQGLLRHPDDRLQRMALESKFGDGFLDLSSNDYLGLAGSGGENLTGVGLAVSRETLAVTGGAGTVSRETANGESALDVSRETLPLESHSITPGAGASRLIFGTHPMHLEIEQEVASWVGMESALLFSSGYTANIGTLSSLLSPKDAVFMDRLNHASLIDGVRLSPAKPRTFPHLDLDTLAEQLGNAAEAPARWVIVESYYSMDGDGPDLRRLRELCDAHDAYLYVDEAHGLGLFGPSGAGCCAEKGIRADVLMAGFGKAVGSQGACVCGPSSLRRWLWNRARSFVFSTAPSPLLAASTLSQLRRCQNLDEQRSRVHEIAGRLRRELETLGLELGTGGFGPIIGLRLGAAEDALLCAAYLREQGILAQAIRPPTVPTGQCRVRITLHADLTDRDVNRVVRVLRSWKTR